MVERVETHEIIASQRGCRSDYDVKRHFKENLGLPGPLMLSQSIWHDRFLVGLLHHKERDIHREASRAIANLLASFLMHEEIINDGLPGLLSLGLSSDPECQYNAALALRKLSPNLKSHFKIFNLGGLKTLFTLIQVDDLKTRRQAGEKELHPLCVVIYFNACPGELEHTVFFAFSDCIRGKRLMPF